MSKFSSLLVACGLLVGTSASSFALPSGLATHPVVNPKLPVTTVREGCGIAFHRNLAGVCVPNGGGPGVVVRPGVAVAPGVAIVVPGGGRVCPRGFHLGPAGRECRPN